MCIVEHPGFEAVCLNYWELQATWQYKQKYGASAYEGSDHKKKQAHCLQAIGKVVLGLPLSIAFWNSVTLFCFVFYYFAIALPGAVKLLIFWSDYR